MSQAEKRAEMPQGKNSVLDRRTVVNGNANLLKLIGRGSHVLDVGCGSGAITKDIAQLVGSGGFVKGIDSSGHLIRQAQESFSTIKNLSFEVADINTFSELSFYDVATSARVLQWVSNPFEVLQKMVACLKPGGCLTILDYNHEKVEFSPTLPESMETFYQAFLRWRREAGMNNAIADHLEDMFARLGLTNISIEDYSEVSIRGKAQFGDEVVIWNKVAEARGPQLVNDQYVSEEGRLAAIKDYSQWIQKDGQYMKLYLKAVTGYVTI
ncbi:MAG: class I SAM-dependent methyltransferase [Chryseolinea sp.]